MHVIEVLGPGCQKCQYVEKVVREVVAAEEIEAEILHVTDYAEIAQRGVMFDPRPRHRRDGGHRGAHPHAGAGRGLPAQA